MIRISGKYFDGRTSAKKLVILEIRESGRWALLDEEDSAIIKQGERFKANVSPRLAQTPRYLNFSEDDTFETEDNERVDQALKLVRKVHWSSLVHVLESRFRYVFAACILFVLVAFTSIKYGIPVAATLIADQIPGTILQKTGEQTLSALDRTFLSPSQLNPDRVRQVRHHLQSAVEQYPDLELIIVFRKGGPVGPNAFALPSGHVVFTDELVQLAEDDNELLSILAHEIGHIQYRHGLRRLIQDSILSFAILSVTGDASGVSELFLGLPVVFTELGYSRKFELEADLFARDFMIANSIDLHHFADILLRIDKEEDPSHKKYNEHEHSPGKWSGYLSTHPDTRERIKRFSDPDLVTR